MMKTKKIRVAILEDHQSTLDGYLYRINEDPNIVVVAAAKYGEEIEPMLENHAVDVLLLGLQVPISASNSNPYPIVHIISGLVQRHPEVNILVISMHTQPALMELLVDAGVSGYIYKNDANSIKQLVSIMRLIADGGIYFSQEAYQQLRIQRGLTVDLHLSLRQIEVLSLCAAYPDSTTADLAEMLEVADSTVRNLLSSTYHRLGVHTRAAAIAEAQKIGLLLNLKKLE